MEHKVEPDNAENQPNRQIESLVLLINSIDTKEWKLSKHRELLSAIVEVLNEDALHPSLDRDVSDRIAQYFALVLCHCPDADIVDIFHCTIGEYPTDQLGSIMLQLITLMLRQFAKEEWPSHEHMCTMIRFVLNSHLASLHQTVIERMFDYLSKIILLCENVEIETALQTVAQFPLSKIESSLSRLIDSSVGELQSEQSNCYRHENMCYLIGSLLLEEHRDELQQNLIDRMFAYVTKLTFQFESFEQRDISRGIFLQFPLSKIESSLPHLIDSLEGEFQTDQTKWCRHESMCFLIINLLEEHRDELQQNLIDRMFAYVTKLIFQFESFEQINCSLGTFFKFPLSKIDSSLSHLIDSLEDELQTQQCNWCKHKNMSLAIELLLDEHADSFQQNVIDQIFDYLIKIIVKCENDDEARYSALSAILTLPSSKLESSLSQWFVIVFKQLKPELIIMREKHAKMLKFVQKVLNEQGDSLDEALLDRMLDYVTKLLVICEIEAKKDIEEYFSIFAQFPLSKLQSTLPPLIDSLESDLKTGVIGWHRHEYMCFVIQNVLKIHRDSLVPTVIERMYDYVIMTLQRNYFDDDESYVFVALRRLPLLKLQSSFVPLIESMKSELDTEMGQVKWAKQEDMCCAIRNVLYEHADSLDQADIDRLFDYVIKVNLQWQGYGQMYFAPRALVRCPLSKLQSTLPQLMDSIEGDLKAKQCNWRRQQNMCVLIETVLLYHGDSLDQSYTDRFIHYLTNVILQCENKEQLSAAKGALGMTGIEKLKISMIKLIETLNGELEQAQQSHDWRRHNNVCLVFYDVHLGHANLLDTSDIDRFFDYLTKVIEQCENANLILGAFKAFLIFPLSKLECSFPSLIDSLESDLSAPSHQLHRHQNMCGVVQAILERYQFRALSPALGRMLDYCATISKHLICADLIPILNENEIMFTLEDLTL